MATGDLSGDGQAEPTAWLDCRAAGVGGPVVPLEDVLAVIRGHAGPVVNDVERAPVLGKREAHPHVGLGVPQGVLEEIAGESSQLQGVATHADAGDLGRVQGYRRAMPDPPGLLAHQCAEVEQLWCLQAAGLLVDRPSQHLPDEHLHLGAGEEQSAGQECDVDGLGLGQGDFEFGAQTGQRALEVVAEVSDQRPLRLRAIGGGGGKTGVSHVGTQHGACWSRHARMRRRVPRRVDGCAGGWRRIT